MPCANIFSPVYLGEGRSCKETGGYQFESQDHSLVFGHSQYCFPIIQNFGIYARTLRCTISYSESCDSGASYNCRYVLQSCHYALVKQLLPSHSGGLSSVFNNSSVRARYYLRSFFLALYYRSLPAFTWCWICLYWGRRDKCGGHYVLFYLLLLCNVVAV